jgi:hypothetical protein
MITTRSLTSSLEPVLAGCSNGRAHRTNRQSSHKGRRITDR